MKNITYILKQLIYFSIITIIVILSFSVFFLFKPFDYIDGYKSVIECIEGRTTSSGASIIFSYDGKIDEFNHIKALKLCAYDIVFDYINQFPIPKNIEYKYIIKTAHYSSWLQALFVVLLVIGFFLSIFHLFRIELLSQFKNFYKINKIISSVSILIIIFVAFIFFHTIFRPKLQVFYCKNILRVQLKEFKLATNLSGKEFPRIEYDWAKNQEPKFFSKCMRYGYIYRR